LNYSSNTATIWGGLFIIVVLLPMIFYALWLQKKAMNTQGGAVGKIDRSLELQEQESKQSDRLIALQMETNDLLREMNAKLDRDKA